MKTESAGWLDTNVILRYLLNDLVFRGRNAFPGKGRNGHVPQNSRWTPATGLLAGPFLT